MSASSLVVQAPAIAADALQAIAAAAGAKAIVPLGLGTPVAYRLPGVREDPSLVDGARALGCDAAFVPDTQTFERVRVVALDMDSTLITIECIDEIAAVKGIKPEVAAITASAMRGEIDFAESLTRRVALLAGLPVAELARAYDERLQITPGVPRLLAACRAAGVVTAVLSGGFTFFTDRLRERLGLDVALANVFETAGDRLTGGITGAIVDAQAKAVALRELAGRHRGADGIVVAIGDGANDLPMFEVADVSIAYRAKPVVRAVATHAIDACGLDAALNWFV